MTLGNGFRGQIFRLPRALDAYPLLPYTAGVVGSGANTVVRVGVARGLRGFDAMLGTGTAAAGGEDLDLYIRLLRQGHAIAYEPGAIVWHTHPSSAAQLRRQVYRYGIGLGTTFAKQLLAGPEFWRLVRAVPSGIAYLFDPAARKNAAKRSGYPRSLDWLERSAMFFGTASLCGERDAARVPRPESSTWMMGSRAARCLPRRVLCRDSETDLLRAGHS